jgi:hypothetical protein
MTVYKHNVCMADELINAKKMEPPSCNTNVEGINVGCLPVDAEP